MLNKAALSQSLVIFIYLSCGVVLQGCTNMFFQPMAQHVASPDDYGLEYEDVVFKADNGLNLHGWWFPSQDKPAKASVIFLHGNGENISSHAGMVAWMTEYQFDVFIFDYRGYGKSQGDVGIRGAINDIQSAQAYVNRRKPGEKSFLLGHSLGASLGVYSLQETTAGLDGAILVSPFSRYPQVAREMMARNPLGWLLKWPASWLVSGEFDPLDAVAQIDADFPVAFVYSEQDRIIAAEHVKLLYRNGKGDKLLRQMYGLHNQLFAVRQNRERVLEILDNWLQE